MIRPAPEPEIRGFLFFCIFPSVRFSLHVPILVSAPILAHAAPWACACVVSLRQGGRQISRSRRRKRKGVGENVAIQDA